LGEEDAFGEVGPAEVSSSAVSPDEIGQPQVGAAEVGADEVRPSEVDASQVGALEVGSDEVGTSAIRLPAADSGSYEFARAGQQDIDVSPVCCHVQPQENFGAAVSEAFGLVEREAELMVDRAGSWQRQRFGQIPEQLMELAHDREDGEHLLRGSRDPPPVLSAEGDSGDFLARAEAVVHGATRKALSPELSVNAASEVRLQIGTGMSGVLVDCEIR
jgi:hypothetical protein